MRIVQNLIQTRHKQDTIDEQKKVCWQVISPKWSDVPPSRSFVVVFDFDTFSDQILIQLAIRSLEMDKKETRRLVRNIVCGVIVVLILVSFFRPVSADEEAGSQAEKKGRKLQIGIKKRPETCERKSKKDDILHIHYRVINWLIN